jgi:hypothetical protein
MPPVLSKVNRSRGAHTVFVSVTKRWNPRLGRCIVKGYGEESVKAFVPPPLPPDPPVRLDAGFRPPEPLAVHLRLHPQGGGALVSNRGISILALRPAPVRERGGPRRAPQRRLGGIELRRGPEPRLERLRGGFPLSLRLIREIHGVLLSKGRGSGKQPGEFRHSQNWIGGTRPGTAIFVPPPPELVPDCKNGSHRRLRRLGWPTYTLPFMTVRESALDCSDRLRKTPACVRRTCSSSSLDVTRI